MLKKTHDMIDSNEFLIYSLLSLIAIMLSAVQNELVLLFSRTIELESIFDDSCEYCKKIKLITEETRED